MTQSKSEDKQWHRRSEIQWAAIVAVAAYAISISVWVGAKSTRIDMDTGLIQKHEAQITDIEEHGSASAVQALEMVRSEISRLERRDDATDANMKREIDRLDARLSDIQTRLHFLELGNGDGTYFPARTRNRPTQ